MELNPYESPKTDKPLARSQIVKRSVGLAAVLLLTPPAMVIAVFVCCNVGVMFFPAHRLLVVFGIPLGILVGLTILAATLRGPRKDDLKNTGLPGIGVLLATPCFVALATVVGVVLAGLTYLAAELPGGSMPPWADWAMMAACWSPPSITLLVMLWLVWRNR